MTYLNYSGIDKINNISKNQLSMISNIARNTYENSLTLNNYDEVFYDIFADQNKISKKTDIKVKDLDNDENGVVELDVEGYKISSLEDTYNSYDISDDGFDFVYGQSIFVPIGNSYLFYGAAESDGSNNKLWKYSFGTEDDVSTLTLEQDESGEFRFGIFIDSSGDRFLGLGETKIRRYDASSSWDISTLSSGDSYDIESDIEKSNLRGMAIDEDCTMMIVLTEDGYLYEFTFGTAWDVTTLNYEDESYEIESEWGGFSDITCDPTLNNIYVTNESDNKLRHYNLSTAGDLTTISHVYTQDMYEIGDSYYNMKGLNFNRGDDAGELLHIYDQDDYCIKTVHSTGYLSSGDFESTTKDLEFVPSKLILQQESDVPSDTDLEFVVYDDDDNSVTVNLSDVGSEIDCSHFTNSVIFIKVKFDNSGGGTPTLHNYGVMFI